MKKREIKLQIYPNDFVWLIDVVIKDFDYSNVRKNKVKCERVSISWVKDKFYTGFWYTYRFEGEDTTCAEIHNKEFNASNLDWRPDFSFKEFFLREKDADKFFAIAKKMAKSFNKKIEERRYLEAKKITDKYEE